jgi:hypothetical protein
MLTVNPDAEVTTPLRSQKLTPSRYSVMPGTVAVNTVAVLVASTCANGIDAVASAAAVASPAAAAA